MNGIDISQGQSQEHVWIALSWPMQSNIILLKLFIASQMNKNVKISYHNFVITDPQR